MIMFRTIDFEGQIKVLFALIACGFLLICLTALLALNGLKYDYDVSFAKRAYKIDFLERVKKFYTDMTFFNSFDEFKTRYKAMVLDWETYQNFQEQENVLVTLKKIYQNFFLQQEIQKIQKIDSRLRQSIDGINASIKKTMQIAQTLQWGDENEVYTLLLHSIEIDSQIGEVFHLQTQSSFIQDKIADSIYSTTLYCLCIFMGFVTFITLYLARIILRFIKDVNLELQQTIQEQTRQLQESNKNLQRTIDKEIEQSRKKDRIMYQQARLASIGEMIQNIAHQWRQPLNSLIILIQSFKIKYDNNKLNQNFIDTQIADALRIAKNMSDTIENFRNFFRPNIHKSKFSIAKSIQDSIALVNPILRQNNIEIFFHKGDDVEILGYENAFSQVVLNLIKNAQDVFLESSINDGVIEIWLVCDNNQVCIQVMDNGGGIKLKDIYKIFEPYFTTKYKSDGTGIGLYMVKQIVEKQMNGVIEVKNQEWRSLVVDKVFYGAVFMIKFSVNEIN